MTHSFTRFIAMSAALVLLCFAAPPTTSRATAAVPRFEVAACPVEVPAEPIVECGYLTTPLDYSVPEGDTVRMLVLIVRSPAPDPASDPVLFTLGGPGFSSAGAAWSWGGSEIIAQRDVIILEQRGNRYAEPSLVCDASVWWEAAPGNTPCLDRLREAGIDPRHFTSADIAADIEALRQVLGYETWNLYGSSYSARLMQLVMHASPDSVRSVILQSTSPLNDTRLDHDPEYSARALGVLLADCAADDSCAAAYPNLEVQLHAAIGRLNADPVIVTLADPSFGALSEVTVDGDALIGWLTTDAFYRPARPPFATAFSPLLISQVNQGEVDVLHPWAAAHYSRYVSQSDWAWGLYFAVNCQEGALLSPEELAARAAEFPELGGYARHTREMEVCEAWGLPKVEPFAPAVIESDIPTLILAGAYDPITPPEGARIVSDGLVRSHVVVFFSAGHDVSVDNPCAMDLVAAFVANPRTEPDLSCVDDVPGPEFVLPADVLNVPSMYEYYSGHIGYSQREHDLYLFAERVFRWTFVLGLASIVVVAILRRRRRHGDTAAPDRIERHAPTAAVLVAGLFYAFSIQMRAISHRHAVGATLRAGVPAEDWPWFVVPLVATGLSIVLAVAAVFGWRRRYWPVYMRMAITLFVLVALAFAWLLARWGWLSALV